MDRDVEKMCEQYQESWDALGYHEIDAMLHAARIAGMTDEQQNDVLKRMSELPDVPWAQALRTQYATTRAYRREDVELLLNPPQEPSHD